MGWGLLGAFTLLTVLSGGAVIWFGDKLVLFAFIVPIVFLFIAIGAFLLLLLHYADTLHTWRPAMPVSALGLPDGSIRAFLTIGLIVLVAVFGTFIYFESGKSASYVVVRADVAASTPDELTALRQSVGDRFIVIPHANGADVVAAAPDTTRGDIAKQLLTVITTVLTTVIGFYFGSRAAEGSTGEAGSARRSGALREIAAWTQNVVQQQKDVDDLVAQAAKEATALKTTGSDADGKAAGKLEGLKTKLAEAFAALRAAAETATRSPDDDAAVLAARDKAKEAHEVVAAAETKLKDFIEKKDPAVL